MSESTLFNDAASAFETVRATVEGMKIEYGQLCIQIADTQSALRAAPLLRVPLADLKAGILDFVDACGERYAQDTIVAAISNFALNNTSTSRGNSDSELANKPLRFCDIESAVLAGDRDFSTQLATPFKQMFDDRALYALATQQVKDRIAALMNTMSPAQFGYNSIPSDAIGSDRVTRRAAIAALNATLSQLQAQRSDLGQKLTALGVADTALRNLDQAATVAKS